MNEAPVWLIYCLAGVASFLTTYCGRWRFLPSVLVGTTVSLAANFLLWLGRGGTFDDPWFGAGLFTNTAFALIAAVLGAGLASDLRWRPRGD